MKKALTASRTFFALAILAIVCFCNLYPSCSVSTASLSDAKVCSTVGSDGSCGSDDAHFPATTPVIYFTANVKNAPSDTKVTFEWKHEGQSMGKADVTTAGGIVNSTLKSPGVFAAGKYSVTATISTDNAKPITKDFTIDEAQ